MCHSYVMNSTLHTWNCGYASTQHGGVRRNHSNVPSQNHMHVISWAIQMNLPKVLKKLCTHGWFEDTNADMFVEHGQVEVLL